MNRHRARRQPRQRDGLGAHVTNRIARATAEQRVADLLLDARGYGAAVLDLLTPEEAGAERKRGERVLRDLLRTPEFFELLNGLPLHERPGRCQECGVALETARRGRPRRYCSPAHKQRAYRRRAGVEAPLRETLSHPKFAVAVRWVHAAMEHQYPGRLAAMEEEREADQRRRWPELYWDEDQESRP